jgi:FkbM family methyltransferase
MFVDVGANVGSYSILASSERGAKTISIEPIPTTFEVLKDNILLNDIKDKVTCRNIALGNMKSVLKFTKSLDTVNHVARAQDTDTVDVRVERFDDIIELQQPTLVKIDVEGYETDVLQGMSKALINEQLKVVIIELNGSGKRYGYDEKKIHEKFLSYGFAPYSYEPYSRKLTPLSTFSSPNSLYVKDLSFVLDRLETAKSFKINGQVI